ncbi:hypothetical protein SDC9_157577 [bioreactor metagenome]|uniref:Uncharacterized protein n=1 Tax=bioreactor metagenome TaxID=1076179 RepID=A0A645F9P4_9ZZZZ
MRRFPAGTACALPWGLLRGFRIDAGSERIFESTKALFAAAYTGFVRSPSLFVSREAGTERGMASSGPLPRYPDSRPGVPHPVFHLHQTSVGTGGIFKTDRFFGGLSPGCFLLSTVSGLSLCSACSGAGTNLPPRQGDRGTPKCTSDRRTGQTLYAVC